MSSSDSDGYEDNTVVIDNGTGNIRAGLAGDKTCRVCFPTIIGHTDGDDVTMTSCIGHAALSGEAPSSIKHPMECGIVTDWDAMEKVWRFAFRDLGVDAEDSRVLVSEVPLNPTGNREKMLQILFEKFKLSHLMVARSPVLALYASGRTTGLVLDSGDGVTSVTPIVEGAVLEQAVRRQDFAGRDVTKYFSRLLAERGLNFQSGREEELLGQVKIREVYVAEHLEEEVAKQLPFKEVVLPDGRKVEIGDERFRCAEALFRPSLLGLPFLGLPQLLSDSLLSAEIDTRHTLLQSVILAGANCMHMGLAQRVRSDLDRVVSTELRGISPKVIAPPERRSSTWLGGSVLASLSSTRQKWLTRAEYEEYGPSMAHRFY